MARYIDMEKINVSEYVVVWECNCSENGRQMVMAVDDLQYLPTADVQEVKHGKWVLAYNPYRTEYFCDNCRMGVRQYQDQPYCSECGAKMDKGCL